VATEAHEAEGEKTKGDEPETKTQRGLGRVRKAQESFGSASENSLKMSDLGRRWMSRTRLLLHWSGAFSVWVSGLLIFRIFIKMHDAPCLCIA
jgi:hypothetical protein